MDKFPGYRVQSHSSIVVVQCSQALRRLDCLFKYDNDKDYKLWLHPAALVGEAPPSTFIADLPRFQRDPSHFCSFHKVPGSLLVPQYGFDFDFRSIK